MGKTDFIPLVSKSQVRRIMNLLTVTIPHRRSQPKKERKSWQGLKLDDLMEFLEDLDESGGTAPKQVYKVTKLLDEGVVIESQPRWCGEDTDTFMFLVRSPEWKKWLRRIPVRESKKRGLV